MHWYDPIGHALVQVRPPLPGVTPPTLIVTGIPWRTSWKYAERGFRHIYWDAGSVLAQTLALAESAGFQARLWTRFPDAEVSSLVGADGVEEFPVALVGLGDGDPAIHPGGEAHRGSVGESPTEFPLVALAQHAGDLDQLGDPWPARAPLPGDAPGSDDLDTLILRRGSARSMKPEATVSRDAFDFSLAAGLRGTTVLHFVAAHAVDGLEPGLYRWPDLDGPTRPGPIREELLTACWDMDLGRDAAFVVLSAIDLETVDDRGYREAQLDAGIVSGRLHLAAYALGIGASGMSVPRRRDRSAARRATRGAAVHVRRGARPTRARPADTGRAGLDHHATVGRDASGRRRRRAATSRRLVVALLLLTARPVVATAILACPRYRWPAPSALG